MYLVAKDKKPYKKPSTKHSSIERWWRRYEYRHTTLALLALAAFIIALDSALIQGMLLSFRELGSFGIFLAGILFVSFFTVGPATIILISIAPDYNPFLLSLIAGVGTVIGDWLILKFFEEQVAYELRPLAKKYGVLPIIRQMKTRKFRPFAVIVGMLFIASPGPDEVGLGLLGLNHTPAKILLPMLFLLNAGGILLLVLGARAVTSI